MHITVGTFNVWGTRGKRMYKIIGFLRDLDLDIVGLQEVSKSSAGSIAKSLNMNHIWYEATHLGNGLLFKKSIIPLQTNTITLDVNSSHEKRGAIYLKCKTPIGNISIVTTHLDHISEPVRLEQWKQLMSKVPKSIDIVVGDFNSLYLVDYDELKLKEIIASREESNWEFPTDELLRHIIESGWTVSQYQDWTSRFKTRVDYIIYRKGLVTKQSVHNTMKISDHKCVTAVVSKQ